MPDQPVGRGAYELELDNSKVRSGMDETDRIVTVSGQETERKYASLGERIGPLMTKGITAGVRVVATSAAAMFGVAAAGALRLEDIQAEYQAATGASADEAERVSRVINKVAGDNRTSLEAVAAAAEKVHNDLGAVGDQADKLTASFVEYARVTKQDAAGSVAAFDDILDAWNLDASHAQDIMDKLVVSHQRYGGEITANQAALSRLAPQLQALNVDIDGAIGLLNLFASSGIDASQAAFALNSAVSKLKPGQSLDDLIRQISSIEDPTLRAQKAIEIFGARGGPQLAQALRPGINSVRDFEVSQDDAADATHRAADIIDSTWGARFQKLLSQAGAAVREFGAQWGPAFNAISAAGSIATAIGADELVKGFAKNVGPKLAGALKAAGQKGAEALGDGFSAVWEGAEGTVVGNFIASRIENIADPTKNTLIGNAWRGAASKSATIYLTALYAQDAVANAILSRVGTKWGGILGKAMAVGAVVGLAAIADEAEPELAKLGGKIHDAIGLPDIDLNPNDWPWPLGNKGAPDWARIKAETKQNLGDIAGETAALALATSGSKDELQLFDREALNATRTFDGYGSSLRTTAGQAAEYAAKAADAASAGHEVAIRSLEAATGVSHLAATGAEMTAWERRFRDGLFKGANDARQARDALDQEWAQLIDDMKNLRTRSGQIAHDVGRLASERLRKALNDGRPAIRREAQGVQLDILNQLDDLVRNGDHIGKKGMQALRDAIDSKNPAVAAAAQRILDTINGKTDKLPTQMHNDGARAVQGFANGMLSKIGSVANAAFLLSGAISDNLRVRSPAKKGPMSEGGGPEGWGRRFTELYAKGVGAIDPLHGAVRSLTGSLAGLSGLMTPQLAVAALAGPMLAGAAGGGGNVFAPHIGDIHLHDIGSDVSPAAAKRHAQDILDLVVDGFREQSARYVNGAD